MTALRRLFLEENDLRLRARRLSARLQLLPAGKYSRLFSGAQQRKNT